jgi:uncharacterized protein YfaS (alpha-2-macroglobulin family)
MILAQKDSDFSFMPFQTRGRELELSRFDTGGIENEKSAQQVSAYLFSDRGIYRPGETTHLGLIARTADWKSSLAGLPIEVDITDSRGAVVSRNALKLSAAAFEEIAFASQPAAPTGTYEATGAGAAGSSIPSSARARSACIEAEPYRTTRPRGGRVRAPCGERSRPRLARNQEPYSGRRRSQC